jgi:threonine/homoserine efflux transporter RhtA
VRRCLVNRFPFGVLYSLETTGVFILAVMHNRRRPDYWKSRH